ncbi:MAG: hypothetical protein AAGG81_09270, partial [Chlamydiota bacterium]
MTSHIKFDHKGTMGPTTALLFDNKELKMESEADELTRYVKERYMHMEGPKPKGRKELCQLIITRNEAQKPITISEMLNTRFFKMMQWQGEQHKHHHIVKEQIVPKSMKFIKSFYP